MCSTSEQQQNAAEERVRINDADTLTTRAQICGSTTIPAAEFHFMVKSGTFKAILAYMFGCNTRGGLLRSLSCGNNIIHCTNCSFLPQHSIYGLRCLFQRLRI